MSTLTMVVPEGVDDLRRPSGGNVYDRRVRAELVESGWTVGERRARGSWPSPDGSALRDLAATLASVPDGERVLVDGLVASGAAPVVVPEAARLALATLVHMPFGPSASEAAVLRASATVVTTSRWTRDWVLDRYGLEADTVRVAVPGADPAPLSAPSSDGGRLLSVGAATRVKGADVLVEALGRLTHLGWQATWVGSLEVEPEMATWLVRRAEDLGVDGRLTFVGARTGADLGAAYAAADLLVVPSRIESYGLVLTEALARGVPVLASDVGGVREALGGSAAGPPGLLVAPDDPRALAEALRRWLTLPDLRARLRRAAVERRSTLRTWSETAHDLAEALRRPAAEPAVTA